MFAQLSRPAVIAHRGASRQAPENTIQAFQLAFSQGADGLELDVRLTKDHRLVVFHDAFLSRTTSGSGRVSHTPYSTIRSFHTDQGLKVPLLDEVLADFARRIPINIELKCSRFENHTITSKAADLLGSYTGAPVLVSSFNLSCLAAFHRLCPEIPLGWILPGGKLNLILAYLLVSLLPLASIHLPYPSAVPDSISRFQARGLKVLAYTVNNPAAMLRLVEAGLEGFFTDDPALARKTLSVTNKVK